jgi:hypothetical protein
MHRYCRGACLFRAPVDPLPLSLPQDVAQLADGRPLVFAGLFLPVLGWVAFNIGAPALRQIDAMGDKGAAPAKKATKKR